MTIPHVAAMRLLFSAGAVAAAMLASQRHIGAFNVIALPGYVAFATSLILLDLTIYLQHWLFHALPWLWRSHRVHHADPEVDVSAVLRFHPAESLLSMVLKASVVIALGMPAPAVLAFEITLNGAAMFNHANAALPGRIEPWLRFVLVTPDMHCIHHSTTESEANSNFGFSRQDGIDSWEPIAHHQHKRCGRRIGLPDAHPQQNTCGCPRCC